MFRYASTLLPDASTGGMGSWKSDDEISVSMSRLWLKWATLSVRSRASTKLPQSICLPAGRFRPPRRSGWVKENTWILPLVVVSS